MISECEAGFYVLSCVNIDNFKVINAQYGTQTGDNVICHVSATMAKHMAEWLGMAVIAEGVEDKRLADYLKSIGCYYIQGYFYAKPMPVDIYERLSDVSDKEHKLSRLKTLETFDSNEFWNPKSMDTLIFNSYVGGTCIFEYHNGRTHILRLNDQYIQQFGGIIPPGTELHGAAVSKYMNESDRAVFFDTIDKAVSTHKEASCEVKIANGNQTEYIRVTVRTLARTDDRILCYGVAVNMTEQRMAEESAADKLRAVLDSVSNGITAAYTEGDKVNFIIANDKFYKIHGIERSDDICVSLKQLMELTHTENRRMVSDAVASAITTGEDREIVYRIVRNGDETAWIKANVSTTHIAGMEPLVQITVFSDITAEIEYINKLRIDLQGS